MTHAAYEKLQCIINTLFYFIFQKYRYNFKSLFQTEYLIVATKSLGKTNKLFDSTIRLRGLLNEYSNYYKLITS